MRPLAFLLLLTGCPTDAEPPDIPDIDTARPEEEDTGSENDRDTDTEVEEECRPHDNALAQVAECGLTASETPYARYLDNAFCDFDCELRCIAEADCADLDLEYDMAYEDDACSFIDDPTGRCVYSCETCDTPLVLSFDAAPVDLVASAHTFDFGEGPARSDWPSAETPWLTLDRDGDGRVNDASELFGDATPLPSGDRATNGFDALRPLDVNADGRLDARDAAWSKLRLWADFDADRRSTPVELRTLSDAGVTALDLACRTDVRCDERGNCERERSAFTFQTATGPREGALVDVYLRTRAANVARR